MGNGLWKLGAMACVIAVGSLVAFQAQQGLSRRTLEADVNAANADEHLLSSAAPDEQLADNRPNSQPAASRENPFIDDQAPNRPARFESARTPDADADLVPISPKLRTPAVDASWQDDPFAGNAPRERAADTASAVRTVAAVPDDFDALPLPNPVEKFTRNADPRSANRSDSVARMEPQRLPTPDPFGDEPSPIPEEKPSAPAPIDLPPPKGSATKVSPQGDDAGFPTGAPKKASNPPSAESRATSNSNSLKDELAIDLGQPGPFPPTENASPVKSARTPPREIPPESTPNEVPAINFPSRSPRGIPAAGNIGDDADMPSRNDATNRRPSLPIQQLSGTAVEADPLFDDERPAAELKPVNPGPRPAVPATNPPFDPFGESEPPKTPAKPQSIPAPIEAKVIDPATLYGDRSPTLEIDPPARNPAMEKSRSIFSIPPAEGDALDAPNLDVPKVEPRPNRGPAAGSASPPAGNLIRPATDVNSVSTPSITAPVATPVAAIRGDGEVTASAPRGLQQPRLTIEKIAPQQAVLGQPLIYSVVVKNAGGTDATQVVVEDRIPKGAELIGTSPRAELDDKRLIWKIGTLKPNESRKLSVKVTPLEEGSMGSVARVNFVAEVAAEIVISAPQFSYSMTMPNRVKLGEPVKVLFKVRNTGKVDAQDVLIRNIVPAGLKHPAGADVEYLVGSLAVGESREVTLELAASKVGRIANKGVLTAKGAEPQEQEAVVEVFGEQLTLTQTGPTKLFIGRTGIFTNTLKNDGNVIIPAASITQRIPIGVDFVEASHGGRLDPTQRKVVWHMESLAAGEERAVTVKVQAKATGQIATDANAATRGGASATVAGQTTIEGMPSLTVEQLADNRPMAIGERATLKIQLKNRGTAEARQVGFAVEVPQGLKVLTVRGPGRFAVNGAVLNFEAVGELNAQGVLTYELQVEAVAAGDHLLGLQVEAEHLPRPIHRDEAIQVIAEDRPAARK